VSKNRETGYFRGVSPSSLGDGESNSLFSVLSLPLLSGAENGKNPTLNMGILSVGGRHREYRISQGLPALSCRFCDPVIGNFLPSTSCPFPPQFGGFGRLLKFCGPSFSNREKFGCWGDPKRRPERQVACPLD